ncbi:MAG: hypothetical protein LUE17_08725 [Planctomycetaceae bacterium]|nr:hypothetical protein [Planctomycetaceae bacterium]
MNTELIEYLKKFYREMPFGVCRELFAVHERNLSNKLDALEANGLVADVMIDDYRAVAQCFRNAIDALDVVIEENGPEMLLGDNPHFTEDQAVDLFQKLLGWRG